MSAAAKRIRTSIVIDPAVYAALGLNPETARSTESQDLAERFAALVAEGARTADRLLSRDEWNLLADALNGFLWAPPLPAGAILAPEVASAIESGRLGEKWSVDGAALVAKLRQLDPAAAEAVAVAVRWFWSNHETIDPDKAPWWTVAFRTGRRGRKP